MIEAGIALLVQGNADVLAIAATGGYSFQVPKGTPKPTWSQNWQLSGKVRSLQGVSRLIERRLQVDCYAETPGVVVSLAAAIDAVLEGYAGTLADADAVVVQFIKQTNAVDFFDDAGRTPRRMLVYQVWSQS